MTWERRSPNFCVTSGHSCAPWCFKHRFAAGVEDYGHLTALPRLQRLTVWPPPPRLATSDFWCAGIRPAEYAKLHARRCSDVLPTMSSPTVSN